MAPGAVLWHTGLAVGKANQNTQEVTNGRFLYRQDSRPDMTFAVDWALNNNYLSIYLSIDKTKQCVKFRHTLPLTKRQTDKHIYYKTRKGENTY